MFTVMAIFKLLKAVIAELGPTWREKFPRCT